MAIKGIDVSSHQKVIDWKKVKNDGIKFAILRAGYGQTHVDDYFASNAKNAISNGIPIGVYWFSYALNNSQALEEAKKCVDVIKKYNITLPVFYDFEYDTVNYAKKVGVTLTKKHFNQFTKTFCDYIQSKGYKAGVYYNLDYKRNWADASVCSKYIEWLAYYSSEKMTSYAIQQYSSSGKVSGISTGNVDMNWLFDENLFEKSSNDTNEKLDEKGEYITVDGLWGKETTRALQKIFKTIIDGVISNQPSSNKKYLTNAQTSSWVFKDKKYKAGSQLIKEIQKKIGATADGLFGKESVKALQKWLKVTVDGYMGKQTVTALQKWINKNI